MKIYCAHAFFPPMVLDYEVIDITKDEYICKREREYKINKELFNEQPKDGNGEEIFSRFFTNQKEAILHAIKLAEGNIIFFREYNQKYNMEISIEAAMNFKQQIKKLEE